MSKLDFKNIAEGHLKKKAKDILIEQLKTGDVIKVKSDLLPIIYHYGIVLKNNNSFLIYHNDPFRLNRKGGNIISEPLNIWIKNKEIVEVFSTNISEQDIIPFVNSQCDKKYHWFNNNCEHFIGALKSKEFFSPQVVGWSIIIASCTLAGIIFFKKKN